MLIAGGSAYPRDWDYAKYKAIADENGALLMMDMAHISGLVATGEANNPFLYCDVVTTTTHKSLRGPRAGMIFFRRDERNFETRINQAVFPGLQGGPHVHQIAGIATQLKEVDTEAFKAYSRQVRANAKALGDQLHTVHGYTLASGGTENHLVLWDLKPVQLTGSKMQTVCDHCSITLNKNAILGDKSALTPGGVRVGSPALTTRGLKEVHFRTVADFLHRAVQIALKLQATSGKLLKDFDIAVKASPEVRALQADVQAFITQFPMPGFDTASMRYKDLVTV
jgi:glycine hydroxymethyltransferase